MVDTGHSGLDGTDSPADIYPGKCTFRSYQGTLRLRMRRLKSRRSLEASSNPSHLVAFWCRRNPRLVIYNRLRILHRQAKMDLDPLEGLAVFNLNIHWIHVNLTYEHNLSLWVGHLIPYFAHAFEPQDMLTVLWIKLCQKLGTKSRHIPMYRG